MTTTSKITGHAAIRYARELGLTLSKYADPTEGARDGLSPDEAEQIAREDASLIWVAVDVTDDQLVALRREAIEAGDDAMAALCNSALRGDANHRAHCAHVIAEAAARE
jgi:hypothetical protein